MRNTILFGDDGVWDNILFSTFPEFSPAEFKEAKVDPISQFSAPITVCSYILCLHTKSVELSLCSSFAVCIPQGHMNKDHADDTKLIVQHSTNVKVSYYRDYLHRVC
jgi:hypothetical protein